MIEGERGGPPHGDQQVTVQGSGCLHVPDSSSMNLGGTS